MTTVQSTSHSEPATDAISTRPDSGLPPEAILLHMFSGYRIPSLLLEVGNVGIPDLLADGPRSVEELARETQLDRDALYRVLRLLASNGVFSEVSPRTFRQTPVSDTLRLLRVLRLNLELPRVLQTGRSGIELAFGMLPFEYFDQHPTESAVFDRAMEQSISSTSTTIADGYEWSAATRVLDIGGGTGTLIGAILSANPPDTLSRRP